MNAFQTVAVEHRGPVAILSLNRPDKLNSMDSTMRIELAQAADAINADDAVKVVVLTGAGKSFSAGADIAESLTGDADVKELLIEEFKPILMAIYNAPKPWIAAVNGAAAGIGAGFALACDLCVMAEDAYLYQAFAAISLIPDGGITWHLGRILGPKRAYELIVGGEKLSGARARELGLCNRTAPADALVDEAVAWAGELAEKAPLSLRYSKQALRETPAVSLAQAIDIEAGLQAICVGSNDAREAIDAFTEKRRPAAWQGR